MITINPRNTKQNNIRSKLKKWTISWRGRPSKVNRASHIKQKLYWMKQLLIKCLNSSEGSVFLILRSQTNSSLIWLRISIQIDKIIIIAEFKDLLQQIFSYTKINKPLLKWYWLIRIMQFNISNTLKRRI